MSSNGWKEVKMGDVISFNPRESIGKKQMAKKIAMENLKPFTKFIDQYELAPFNGGAKFRNGDTLLARITPCLENGKTSQVTILDNDEIGFGSTEFIVFRAEAGITDKDYIYYLSISPSLREIAIKSMIGSSGRQRVQQRVLKDINLSLPPLSEQKAIAATLSCLDDMIELNNRTNQVLEEMAQAIFKRWFVDFEFPNKDGEPYKSSGGEMVDSELGEIPKGWRVGNLGDIANVTSGKRPQEKKDTVSDVYFVPLVGASTVMGFVKEILYNERILIIGRVGTHGIIQRFNSPCWPSDNTLVITSDYYEFTNQILKKLITIN